MAKHRKRKRKVTQETRWAIEKLDKIDQWHLQESGMILNVRIYPAIWVPNTVYEATFPSMQGAYAYAQEHGLMIGRDVAITNWDWEY